MSNSYKSLSIIPDFATDIETWELFPLPKNIYIQDKIKKIINSNFQILSLSRQLSWYYGEYYVRRFLRQQMHTSNNTKTQFDWILKNWNPYEVKTCKIWNYCAVNKNQLEEMDPWGFYFLVYYNIDWFKNLTECIYNAINHWLDDIKSFVKTRFMPKYIYMLPKSDIVRLYNNSKKQIVRNIKQNNKLRNFEYMPVALTTCKKLFEQNPWNHNQYNFEHMIDGNSISIYCNYSQLSFDWWLVV